MEKALFNETTIKRMVLNTKLTAKQKKAVKIWLDHLKNKKLEKEKQAYFEFKDVILKDLLDYDTSLDGLKHEEGNMEFPFRDSSGNYLVVFETKGTKTKNLRSYQGRSEKSKETPVNQINYYLMHNKVPYGVLTNYKEFILFTREEGDSKSHSIDFTELTKEDKIKEFVALFSKGQVEKGFISDVIKESIIEEREFTKEFYKLYHETRLMLIKEFEENDKKITRAGTVHFAQLFLNRLMFVLFAEDTGKLREKILEEKILGMLDRNEDLLSPNSNLISNIIKNVFEDLNKGNPPEFFGFNGGLFSSQIPPRFLFRDFREDKFFKEVNQHSRLKKKKLKLNEKEQEIFNKYKNKINPLIENILLMASFDFKTEVKVNILGHIFEQSISDIENLQVGKEDSRRKKEGIFYTPEYITDYICRNTIIPYLSEKDSKGVSDLIKEYSDNIEKLEKKFKAMKILDPACGSGAFLIKATDIMLEIFKAIQDFKQQEGEYEAKRGLKRKRGKKGQQVLEKWNEESEAREIIENSIYGVDINDESIEITKLALFLKMARKNKKLTNLSKNIKRGNSLIDDPDVAGELAFNWDKEFPFKFDVVVGNPPYVRSRDFSEEENSFVRKEFDLVKSGFDLTTLFIEKGLSLLHGKGVLGFISSNKFFSASYGKLIRKHLVDTKLIKNILNFGSGIFEDTPVETSILVLDKRLKNDIFKYGNYLKIKNISNLIADKKIFIKDFNLLPAKVFFFPKEVVGQIILNKLKAIETKVGDFFKFTAGVGITGIKDKLKRDYFSGSIPVFTGKSIWRYHHKSPEYWTNKSNLKTFNIKRIALVRELSTKNRANIIRDYEEIGLLNSVTIAESKLEKVDVKSFVAIFNSKLFNEIYTLLYESTRTHSNLRFKEIYLNPIPLPNIANSEEFSEKVMDITKLNKEFYEKKNKFFKRIKKSFNLDKINKKLDKFYELEFNDFVKEIEKQTKKKLGLKEQDEWEDYFDDYKKELLKLKEEIEDTDNEINKMVYKLYGLTDEEIGVVEEN